MRERRNEAPRWQLQAGKVTVTWFVTFFNVSYVSNLSPSDSLGTRDSETTGAGEVLEEHEEAVWTVFCRQTC